MAKAKSVYFNFSAHEPVATSETEKDQRIMNASKDTCKVIWEPYSRPYYLSNVPLPTHLFTFVDKSSRMKIPSTLLQATYYYIIF